MKTIRNCFTKIFSRISHAIGFFIFFSQSQLFNDIQAFFYTVKYNADDQKFFIQPISFVSIFASFPFGDIFPAFKRKLIIVQMN